jgi:hypothetical protein
VNHIIAKLLQLDLFADHTGSIVTVPAKKTRVAAAVSGWELVDHACKSCLGRVLQRRHRDGTIDVRCAECGMSAAGGASEICCCGADCGTAGHVLECFRNPEITPAVPQEVLVRERLIEDRRGDRRRSNPVGMQGF